MKLTIEGKKILLNGKQKGMSFQSLTVALLKQQLRQIRSGFILVREIFSVLFRLMLCRSF